MNETETNIYEDCGKEFDATGVPDNTPYAMCYQCWDDYCMENLPIDGKEL
ncbi:hypothetical protein [Dysgonomonas sp. 521]|nr:hypothetical protein [Dysgonomonas sp. 521]